jgi:hypothetical protein
MRGRRRTLAIGFVLGLAIGGAPPAAAATLTELAGWCAPEGGSERLCSGYLETILEGLASTDPVMNGGTRVCVPPEAERTQIVRLVRAHAASSEAAGSMPAIEGVGAALKGRYPCR